RRLLRQFLDPARGGMNSLQQIVERKGFAVRHDDFAVEPERRRLQFERRFAQLGKVGGKVFSRLRAEIDFAALPGEQAAEAVPLRLILPLRPAWNRIDGTRF